ncbi:MAG: UDP-2,3-diacylglucosamine diphosphatase [Flavisolibacter sp.]
MKDQKLRFVEIVILSDVHLGTYGCHAKELLQYLRSVRPGMLVLNGDFIDIWQFNKRYWPKSHMKIIKHLTKLVSQGVPVYYVTGNHDEMLRKFTGFEIGCFRIVNKLILPMGDGKKAWIFHGDVFDVTMRYSKWLAKLGAVGYDVLILLNRMVNFFLEKCLVKNRISLSRKIKNSVKKALTYINDFEKTAAEIGIYHKFDYVICGHIHHPQIKKLSNASGEIIYMNSGDWVEHLTSLEYNNGKWDLFEFAFQEKEQVLQENEEELNTVLLFRQMVNDFDTMKAI